MSSDDNFDFLTEVIGDDIVVGGVAYSRAEWTEDPEDGVRRRDEQIDVPSRMAEEEAAMTRDFLERAEQVAVDFAAVVSNMSTGPRLAELLPRYVILISEARDAGFDVDRIQKVIDAAIQH
ncbi:hypothetical protein [Rhodococcus sp. Q]|uniref:hypothetical protein n=1 Tax=Rhodococcus sp. Q TaxID=2502252 RepID=UPI0010F59C99|nr:hypothetical protein [Rhodococcus sp. Q]